MSNTLLTINMITREAVRLWVNTNSFLQHIDTQYDDQFAVTGAKIGQSLRIRLPNDYTVRSGPVAQPQDTAETNTTLTLATQKGVDVSFNSVERTMSLDDYSKRILAPAVNNLVGAVAADIMNEFLRKVDWDSIADHYNDGSDLEEEEEEYDGMGNRLDGTPA